MIKADEKKIGGFYVYLDPSLKKDQVLMINPKEAIESIAPDWFGKLIRKAMKQLAKDIEKE